MEKKKEQQPIIFDNIESEIYVIIFLICSIDLPETIKSFHVGLYTFAHSRMTLICTSTWSADRLFLLKW